MKLQHEQIQYVEFLSKNLPRISKFYADAFGWQMREYGPEYSGFEGTYVDGGFASGQPVKGSILVILYSENLEETERKLRELGGKITKEIFNFPGGRRFHFEDPDGNELAVWSEK